MLTIEKRADGVLRIHADGQLTTDSYADFVSRFEQFAKDEPGPMRIDLGPDFSGWSVAALWQDHKIGFAQEVLFRRIAVVGDRRWEEWGMELTGTALSGQMRFFEHGEEAGVEEWLMSQSWS